jgi:hypothetical protein
MSVPLQASPTGVLQLPPRPAGALTGTQFYNTILGIPETDREQLIVEQIASGNVPDFMRTLKPITVNATINGVAHVATYFVTPDYMCIGSDADFFRMPMSAPLAQQIADICKCSLPTRKMVNDIYTRATIKLAPYPFSPATYDIQSVQVFWQHNQAVENQRAQNGGALGSLIGGIQKDVIISPTIPTRPSPPRVCIYGWHQLDGTPIQPLSTVHEATYEDYSHGIRLVEKEMVVDNADTNVPAVWADASIAALLSDEGAFTFSRYPVPNPYPLPSNAPNHVTNGSFENGFTAGVGNGWTRWQASGSNTFTIGQASANHYDGSYAQYWSRSDTLAFDGGVYQVVSVTPGATYEVKAVAKRQSVLAGTFVKVGVDLAGGTNPVAASVNYTDITGSTDNAWVQYTATFVASGSNLTVFARGGHSGTTGGSSCYIYLDAVSVIETAAAPRSELLLNGGFENGFTAGVGNSWTKWQATGSNTITAGQASANKQAGSYSQYLSRNDTALFDGGVYQTVAVTPGQTYTITGWIKRQSVISGTFMKIGYDLAGGTNGAAASVNYTDLTGSTDNVWVQYIANVTASSSALTVFCRVGHTGTTGGTNSYFYLDSVSVK